MLEILGAPGTEFSIADLMAKTGWKKTKAYEMASRAEELGCIAEGERRGSYRLVRAHSEPPLSLPDKLWLSARDFRISAGAPN
jgi:DNA-binding IclR family transcriptional regulator